MRLLAIIISAVLAGCATEERWAVVGDTDIRVCQATAKPPCVMGAKEPDRFWAARGSRFGAGFR